MATRVECQMSEGAARAFLTQAPYIRLAGVGPTGRPILRTLNAVAADGALYFHGTPDGEKAALAGQRVVLSADRVVARIASYFVDPRFACPASTYYVSAMAEGTVETVTALPDKARVLALFMTKFQPEGGHLPLDAENPTYRNVLGGLWVGKIPLEAVVGKQKLGQHRSAEQMKRILAGLWQRGEPGDVEAIGELLRAHPARPIPAFLEGPGEFIFEAALGPSDVPEVLSLLRGQYWTEGVRDGDTAAGNLGSVAWVGARLGLDGPLVATARANSDGARHAYVADVAVRADLRRKGVGSATVRFLLTHPRLRSVQYVRLGTRDPSFYTRLGFAETVARAVPMTLERAPTPEPTAPGGVATRYACRAPARD